MSFINNLFLFVFSFLVVGIYSQQSRTIFFDEVWQISTSKHSHYYECHCFVLENGAFDGAFTCFSMKTDAKVKEYNFSNNVLHGEIKEYYENGYLKLHAFYNKGLPIKNWKEWNENGKIVVDKVFDENSRITKNKKQLTEYEKMYFGIKEFETPVFTTECILMKNEKQKYLCSDTALLEYYKHPPLPPYYFNDSKFSGKTFISKLKYLLSEKGKVIDVEIIETSGDDFLDELAEIHVLNMIPFESAKEYENPIEYWIEAEIVFKF